MHGMWALLIDAPFSQSICSCLQSCREGGGVVFNKCFRAMFFFWRVLQYCPLPGSFFAEKSQCGVCAGMLQHVEVRRWGRA